VDIVRAGGDYRIAMTQGGIEIGDPLPGDVAGASRPRWVLRGKLDGRCPVAIASTGHSKVMVGIRDAGLLHRLSPDMTALAHLSGEIGCNGYYAFTLHPGEDIFVHGRMFAPAIASRRTP
jgi:PhzF family phenazine biosynthesis protein